MTIKIHKSPTALDQQVAAMLTRIGMVGPLDHVQSYTVARSTDGPTIVTVTLIADPEFDPPS